MSQLHNVIVKFAFAFLLMISSVANVYAAPGDILFQDDFERATLAPNWTTTNNFRSAIDTATAQSGTRSLFTRNDVVSTTLAFDVDLDVPAASLTIWVRRGSDTFSELPDTGEDLTIEYLNSGGTFQNLRTFPGFGTPGEIFIEDLPLPTNALHPNFRLRFTQQDGSGFDFDYWHIDGVVVTEAEEQTFDCDDFSDGVPYPTLINGGGTAAVDNLTFQSSPFSMSLSNTVIAVGSPIRDTSAGFVGVSVWVRRGSDAFSENPDFGEDLVIEYLDDTGTWVELETFPGSGINGEIFVRSYNLSNIDAAQHAGFRLRFNMIDGSGAPFDFWHFDDVCFISANANVAASVDVAHDGVGQYCSEEQVTLTVRDAMGDPLTGYVGTVALASDSGSGAWRIISGGGTLSDTDTTDGAADYTFVDADNGVATLGFTYTNGAPSVDIDATETSSGALDDDSEGLLVFNAGGFTVTANPLSNPPPATINDPVATQTAGTDYSVHISAFGDSPTDATCGVIENYNGPRTLAFWQQWINPVSGPVLLTVNSTSVGDSAPTAVPQVVTFTNGQAVVTLKYKDVGDIALEVNEPATGITGATNSHVVRPADLRISTIESSGGTPNPGATTATDTRFVAAGEAFTIQIDARDAEDDLTPSFGLESPGEGIAINSINLVLPPTGRNGILDDGVLLNNTAFSATATPGRWQNTTVAFDEVGIIQLQASIADTDYLGTGNVVGSASGNVGRFHVDTFNLLSSSLTPSCNGFTYMDEPALGVAVILEAQNTLSQRTRNYDTGLLGAGAVANLEFSAENADDGVNLGSRLSITTANWSEGLYSLAVTNADFARPTSGFDGPFDTLSVNVGVADAIDNAVLQGRDTNATTTGDCGVAGDCNAIEIDLTDIYYGRILALPGQGPEDSNLDLGLTAQIWSGSGFITHVDDICTIYQASDLSLADFTVNLNAGETTPIAPFGSAMLLNGQVDPLFPPTLSAPGIGNDGTTNVTFDVQAWLEFDWLGSGDTDPSSIATFGQYRGHDRVVYWRERTR